MLNITEIPGCGIGRLYSCQPAATPNDVNELLSQVAHTSIRHSHSFYSEAWIFEISNYADNIDTVIVLQKDPEARYENNSAHPSRGTRDSTFHTRVEDL